MKKNMGFLKAAIMAAGLPALVLAFGLAACDTGTGPGPGPSGNQAVTALNLTDYVTAPAVGDTPAASLAENPPQYTGSIAWNTGAATFDSGTNYTATVTLTAKTGYVFNGVPNFTHSDAQSVNSAAGEGGSITVTIAFEQVLEPGLYVGGAVTATDVSGQSGSGLIAQSLAWLASNASSSTVYTIKLSKNETLPPRTLANLHSANNVTVTLTTVNPTPRTVQLSQKGSLFTVGSNVTLILAGNVIIKGRPDNDTYLVDVNGGTLELEGSAKITGNTSDAYRHAGSGVAIRSGTFNMKGGEISGNRNTRDGGAGVRIYGDGAIATFNMSDGTISGNTGTHGAGVFMQSRPGSSNSNIFTMTGGTITGNIAADPDNIWGSGEGGGVSVCDSSNSETPSTGTNTFTMSGGTISGNTADYGGGVFVVKNHTASTCTFNMTNANGGGTISGNTATYGGGVGISKGNFAKTGGAITGNTATSPTEMVFVVNAAGDNAEAYRNTDAGAGVNITVTWGGSAYTVLDGVTQVPSE
jgi:hypothetical protein